MSNQPASRLADLTDPAGRNGLASAAQLWGVDGDRPPGDRRTVRLDPLEAMLRPGLQDLAASHAAHTGLVATLMGVRGRPVIWVQDALARREHGCPSARGLHAAGLDRNAVVLVRASRARDALWAMEEAVKAGLDVVGEVEGAPRALDFTATRRLELFAQAARCSCILARTGQGSGAGTGAGADAGAAAGAGTDARSSGAHFRWRVDAVAAPPHPHDPHAPGRPRWALALVRARAHPPARWLVERERVSGWCDDEGRARAAHRLRLVSPLAAGDVAPGAAAREGGTVVPLRTLGTGVRSVA